MKRIEPRIFWGILLIVGGALFLLQNMGLFALDNIWPIIFILPGIVFLYAFVVSRENWWAVIPGMALVGVSALIAFEQLFPRLSDNWGASIFLGSLALAFLGVYVRTATAEWWAIIPMGILGSLACLIGLEAWLGGDAFAGLFMIGIGLTFALVYIIPTREGRMRWAIYPASITGIIGLLILIAATHLIRFVGPLFLIALGIYIIFRRSNDCASE